ncbi:hypothetical protein CDAR_250441 [Caerostris darwini]|uniref:Uncharacterized protein n=1 Tax=Caerostris darwini TaxID=1538125 RepID=A0AAV4UEA5_9ARAC|nr:hypothetical protein CDAR_250441 [Caerostris darwini]
MDDEKEGNKNYLISYSGMDKRRDDEKMEGRRHQLDVVLRTIEPFSSLPFIGRNCPPKHKIELDIVCLFPFLFLSFQIHLLLSAPSNFNISLNTVFSLFKDSMDNRRDDEKMEAGTTTPPTGCRFENHGTFFFASVHWEELPP